MMWSMFAMTAAALDATYFVLVKKHLQTVNPYVLSAAMFLVCSVILFVFSLFKGIPDLGPLFFVSVFGTGTLNVVAVILYLKALKETDVSLAVPMLSFTPIFLIVTSFLFLGERPTVFGMAGIVLIVFGSYILNATKENNKLLDPLRSVLSNRGLRSMLIVAFLYSISSNFDKLVVQHSDAIFGSAVVYLFLGVSFFSLSYAKARHELFHARAHVTKFLTIGFVLALAAIAVNIAFTMEIVPYVISIKRISILFSVLMGGMLFKERHMLTRSVGALVMVIGVVLILVL